MEQHISKQGKLSRHIWKIVLCFLICILHLIDAPEYVRCNHLGVCEFLEVIANLDTTQKSTDIMAPLIKAVGQPSDYLIARDRIYTPPSEGISFSLYYFLYRYINPYQNQKVFGMPFTYTGKISIDRESTFPSLNHFISAKTLQMITSTVIRS